MDSEDEEALPTLTKWPFYLGDVILVGLAVTIATLGNWQLGGVQIFACVLAVALGAALLVCPFVTEYLMFAREEKEDRAAEFQMLRKQFENLEAALLKQHDRIGKLESRSGLDDQRYKLLTSAIDQKTQVELPEVTTLMERIQAIEASETKKSNASDAVKKELVALEESVKQVVSSIDALQSRLDTLEKADQQPSASLVKETIEESGEVKTSRKRQKKTDANLLKRAIQEKQEAASTAVSRIIDPENTKKVSEEKAEPAELSKHEEEVVAKAEAEEAGTVDPSFVAQEIFGEIETLPDDFAVSLGADLMVDDDFFDAGEVAEPKKPVAKKAGKSATSQKKQAVASSTSDKPVVTCVEVNKLMGIGNKPFLRGSGAGLSWEKGLEMEFQEIGKWAWFAPADLDEVVEIQIYRNDEDADRKGKHALEPGQRLELSPDF